MFFKVEERMQVQSNSLQKALFTMFDKLQVMLDELRTDG